MAQDPECVNGEVIPAYFEVLDMSQDPRWCKNNYVATEPYFRYYCGVPLRSDNDINIGCLFVLDTELRPAITVARVKCEFHEFQMVTTVFTLRTVLATCARN